MKDIRLLASTLLAGAVLALPTIVTATPYASGVSVSAGTVSFILNEDAHNVAVRFNDGASTNDLGALAKGSYSFELGSATNFQIVVKKSSGPGWKAGAGAGGTAPLLKISTDTNPAVNFYYPRGLAVHRNPASPHFGRIYVANDQSGTCSTFASRPTTAGIYILNADQTDAFGQGDTARTGGLNITVARDSNPFRLTIGEDDNLYICDWSDTTGNLYRTDLSVSDGSGIFALKALTGSAKIPVGTANNHGSIAACYVSGSQAAGNLAIFTIDEDLQPNKTSTATNSINSLWKYTVDGAALPWNNDPTKLWTASSGEGYAAASQTMDLDRGTNGYFYITTLRSSGNESGLCVRSADGSTTLFSSKAMSVALGGTTDYLNYSGGVTVSFDQKWIAVARQNTGTGNGADNKICVMPLTNGIPDLARRSFIAAYSVTNHTANRDIAFDAADNIYVINNGAEAMRVFSPGGTTTAITGNDATGTNGTFVLNTVDPDIASQSSSVTTNAGASVTLTVAGTGTGPLVYQWKKNGAAMATPTTSSYAISNVQQANAGTYVVTVTNALGSVTSSEIVLTVIDSAPIFLTQPISVTTNAGTSPKLTATVQGSDARAYQWTFNGVNIPGATTTAYTRANIQMPYAGSYALFASNGFGIVRSDIATITVNDIAPVITAQPANKTLGAGQGITNSVTATGTDPRFYQWFFNGSPVANATNSSWIINPLQTTDSGTYTCTVTNSIGTATTANAVLTVTNVYPAVINLQPKSITNMAGANVTFTTSAYGDPPISYQWAKNALQVPGATNSSFTITNIQLMDDSSAVSVMILPSYTMSQDVMLYVTNGKPFILTNPVPLGVNPGQTATFSVYAQGENPLTYQWMFNGTNPIPNGTDATLSIPNAQASDIGSYSVVVTSSGGTNTSTAAQLAITVPSTVGTGTGLLGQYYSGQLKSSMGAPTLTRIDPTVDFNWTNGSPDPSISTDYYTVRWSGFVQPLYPQVYTFIVASDDGFRLWFDGKLVLDSYVNQAVTEKSVTISNALDPNKKYEIVLEYFENTSTAEAHLRWSSASQVKAAIASTQLYPATTPLWPELNAKLENSNLILDWGGTFTLQASDKVEGPYTNVLNLNRGWENLPTAAPGPFTNNMSGSKLFFRLKDY